MSVAVGTPTSLSDVKSVPTLVFCMSTTGDSALTVTDSCSDASCSALSTVRIWPRPSFRLPRFVVAKPASSKVSSYSPEGRGAIEYLPSAPVTTDRTPIKDGERAVTVTPGRTAFWASVTVPVKRP